MNYFRSSGTGGGSRAAAFTLIEIVVAITIIAVIAAVAVPTIKGLRDAEQAREPVRELAEMVQEVRQRAIQDKRAYQIVIERGGLHAVPGADPFAKREEFLEFLENLRTPPPVTETERTQPVRLAVTRDDATGPGRTAGSAAALSMPGRASAEAAVEEVPAADEPPAAPWTKSIALDGMDECNAMLWGDGEWDAIEGDELRRWVFQPTGMASPVRVKLVANGTECVAEFDALTGEITSERSRPAGLLTAVP